MSKESKSNFIKEYWEKQAETFQQSHQASWGDSYMIELEIATIGRYIPHGIAVLDAGCGNGYSTIRQFQACQPSRMVGIDFAQNMIAQAKAAVNQKNLGEKLTFKTGDIRSLEFDDNTFDAVYTTRSVINLPSWDEQVTAINECIRVTKPGGIIILSEAFWEPLVLLNAMRALKQLTPLIEHDFNRYIKKVRLESLLRSKGLEFESDDFSSIYYLGSRFLRELITDASKYPGFTNPVNKIFFEIEQNFSGGGFGIQQAYVIKKPR